MLERNIFFFVNRWKIIFALFMKGGINAKTNLQRQRQCGVCCLAVFKEFALAKISENTLAETYWLN